MFTIAPQSDAPRPSPADVQVPDTSVVALLVTTGTFSHELHTGLVRTVLFDQEHGWNNYHGELIQTSGANISKARNELLRRFLDHTNAEWAWMVDSDMAIAEDTLPRLLCAAEVTGAKAIGALCVMVGEDGPIPTTFQLGDFSKGEVTRVMLDYPDNTIVQVAATGAACLLVHRSVLEHFRNERPDLNYPWIVEQEITGQWVSEDILFTLRMNHAGFPVFVDCTTHVGHVKGSTTWWPTDIRRGKGFPDPKTYAVIPSKTPELMQTMAQQLSGQGLERVVLLDNREHATGLNLDANLVHVIPMPGAGIHEMWNAGVDWALEDSGQRRNVNILILNDDLQIGSRFVQRMVEALRSDPNMVAVSGNYDGRTGPLVQEVDDICAGRYDGTGGFAGFAFAARGEWFQSGYRFPEECKWWFGDNDLVLAARMSGVGKVGIAIDAPVVHLDGGGKTGGDWSAFGEQIAKDREAFERRWQQYAAEHSANQPAQQHVGTVSVLTSIYGGYDQPVPLIRQAGVSQYLLVTDEKVNCPPWTTVLRPDIEVEPRYAAKRPKYQPFNYVDTDFAVWLDGRVEPLTPQFVQWLLEQLGDADIALYKHPMRSSILEEAEGALREDADRPAKYTDRDLIGQAKHYLDQPGFVDDKLWQTTFYVARNNDRTKELGRLWQQEQDRYPDCLLDQIPFSWCVHESGVKVADLPGGFWDLHGRLFRLRPHIDGT